MILIKRQFVWIIHTPIERIASLNYPFGHFTLQFIVFASVYNILQKNEKNDSTPPTSFGLHHNLRLEARGCSDCKLNYQEKNELNYFDLNQLALCWQMLLNGYCYSTNTQIPICPSRWARGFLFKFFLAHLLTSYFHLYLPFSYPLLFLCEHLKFDKWKFSLQSVFFGTFFLYNVMKTSKNTYASVYSTAFVSCCTMYIQKIWVTAVVERH